MSAQDVYETVTSVPVGDGFMPCAHLCFKEGSVPPLPWCVYILDDLNGFAADNKLMAHKNSWAIEHYWDSYDPDIEAALENAIADKFGVFGKTETWIEREKCSLTTYTFTEID